MDIQLEKYKLMEWLVGLEDETLISKLRNIQQSLSESGYSNDISKLEKTMIEIGLRDLAEGNSFSHDQVMEEIKEKYGI